MPDTKAFTGSIHRTYHAFLGPLIFEPYARDIVPRLQLAGGERVLELAAGTGIVTAHILQALPRDGTLVATDLSEPMLDVARSFVGADPRLTFSQADACQLPFADASFDALACQYGVMFFPDKIRAMQEARRVLAPGGRYIFNIWDSLEHNPIPRIVHESLLASVPDDPPMFLAKMPFGYSEIHEIERVTRSGGFANVKIQHVELPCIAPAAEDAARGYIEGTPVSGALSERGISDPTPIRTAAATRLAEAFGDRPCRATMRAVVVTAS